MKLTSLIAASLAVSTLGGAAPALAQSAQATARFQQAQSRFDREYQLYRQEVDRYLAASGGGAYRDPAYGGPAYPEGNYVEPQTGGDSRRVAPDIYNDGGYNNGGYTDDRDEGNYDPSRYYRPGQETVLGANDRVYAGQNGRYYCKRSDGTTGLIVGAAGGGILGNVIDGGHSRTVGTLLGAAVGGLAGRAVDQNSSQVRCR
jgi:hypothetical protein